MKHSNVIIGILASVSVVAMLLSPLPAAAIGSIVEGANSARGADQPATLFGESGVFSRVSSVLLFIVGAIAVIMLIIGGLKYVVSGGDASKVQSAKNTILYALVGIVVAILAYAAVNFVIGNFIPSASNGTSGIGSGGGNNGATTGGYGASSR